MSRVVIGVGRNGAGDQGSGVVLVCCFVVVAACGGGGDASMDAGAPWGDAGDEWVIAAPAPPMAPAAAAEPILTPCAPGWREARSRAGIAVCDPWPESGIAVCGPADAHFAGEAGCSPIGTACPSDGVPEGLPPDATVTHVRAGALGGDGTAGSPFGTLGEAVAAAPAGSIIAIAPGSYEESVVLTRDVTLWGACVGETVLAGSDAVDPVVTVDLGVGAVVRNLRIGPHVGRGVWVRGSVALRQVAIEGVTFAGVEGGPRSVVVGEDLVVRRVRLDATAASVGIGAARSRVDLRRVVVEDLPNYGLLGGEFLLENVSIRDITCGAYQGGALGVESTADATQLAIDRICGRGVFSNTTLARITVRDVVIRDTYARPGTRADGPAIHAADDGALITIERAWVAGARRSPAVTLGWGFDEPSTASVFATDLVVDAGASLQPDEYAAQTAPSSSLRLSRTHASDLPGWLIYGSLTATDMTVRWTAPPLPEVKAWAISCPDGGEIRVERLSVDGADSALVAGTFPPAAPTDPCVVRASDVRADHTGLAGVFSSGADIEITRIRVAEGAGMGIALLDSVSRFADVELATIDAHADHTFGWGLLALRGSLDVARARITRHQGLGLTVQGQGAPTSTVAVLRDIHVSEGRGGGGSLGDGYGLSFNESSVRIERAVIEANHGVGVSIFSDEGPTRVAAEDIVVRDTLGHESADEYDGVLGRGVSARGSDAAVTITRGLIVGSREVGIDVRDGALVELNRTRVTSTAQRDCASSTCAGEPGGHGIGLYAARLVLNDVVADRSHLCGLHVHRPVSLEASALTLSRNEFGLCVQDANVSGVLGRVRFADNVSGDVETTDVYIPEAAPTLTGSPVPE